jgi:hypothetical protein
VESEPEAPDTTAELVVETESANDALFQAVNGHPEATPPAPVTITPPSEEVTIDQVAPRSASDSPDAGVERGEAPKPSPDPGTPPVTSEPLILLAAIHSETEPGNNPTEPDVA